MKALKAVGYGLALAVMVTVWLITLPIAWLHARCSIDPG